MAVQDFALKLFLGARTSNSKKDLKLGYMCCVLAVFGVFCCALMVLLLNLRNSLQHNNETQMHQHMEFLKHLQLSHELSDDLQGMFDSIYETQAFGERLQSVYQHLLGAAFNISSLSKESQRYPTPEHQFLSCGSYYGPYNGLKIYMYEMPTLFNDDWQMSWAFGAALQPDHIYHQYLHELLIPHLLQYTPEGRQLLTSDPEEADLFYLRFFPREISLVHSRSQQRERKIEIFRQFNDWLDKQPYASRMGLRDHVIAMAYQWDEFFTTLKGRHKNYIIISPDYMVNTGISRFQFARERQNIVTPYVGLGPLADDKKWAEEPLHKKTIFASFYGSSDIRGQRLRPILKSHFMNFNKTPELEARNLEIRWEESSRVKFEYHQITELYKSSIFCLCPKGDTAQTKRLFDAILAVCIPVILSDEIFLPYEAFVNWREIAIFIPTKRVYEKDFNVIKFLLQSGVDNLLSRQEALLRVRRHFVWHQDRIVPGDAMDFLLWELSFRAMQIRAWKYPYLLANRNTSANNQSQS